MLVHECFVFIHNQKCGGVFVREFLERELGRETLHEPYPFRHVGWERVPTDAIKRPVLCYVRNPWDWYVSWYEFKRQRPAPAGDPIFDHFSNNGEYDFARTVANACEGSNSFAEGEDLYTGSFSYSVGGVDPHLLTVARFESLIDDLDRFLGGVGVELPPGAIARARESAPANATERRPHRAYYDAELRDLVGASCKQLIDRFGYAY